MIEQGVARQCPGKSFELVAEKSTPAMHIWRCRVCGTEIGHSIAVSMPNPWIHALPDSLPVEMKQRESVTVELFHEGKRYTGVLYVVEEDEQ